MQPIYHCKHIASQGDIVCIANTIDYPDNQHVYLVLSLAEEYEGFESYTDDLDGFEKTRDNHTNSDDTLYKKIIEYPKIREVLSEADNQRLPS